MYEMRPATEGDTPAVRDLFSTHNKCASRNGLLPADGIAARLLIDDPGDDMVVMLLMEDSVVAGCVVVHATLPFGWRLSERAETCLGLSPLHAHPDQQGNGLTRLMTLWALGFAARRSDPRGQRGLLIRGFSPILGMSNAVPAAAVRMPVQVRAPRRQAARKPHMSAPPKPPPRSRIADTAIRMALVARAVGAFCLALLQGLRTGRHLADSSTSGADCLGADLISRRRAAQRAHPPGARHGAGSSTSRSSGRGTGLSQHHRRGPGTATALTGCGARHWPGNCPGRNTD